MRYTDIKLVKETDGRNSYGDLVKVLSERTVYAGEYSVGMNEVYQSMANGYKPEVKFRLESWLDYEGEERVKYVPFGRTETVQLRVLRTFNDGDALELTCYKDNEEWPEPPEPDPPEPDPDPEPTEEVDDNANTEITNEGTG